MGTTITADGSLAPWNSKKESPVSQGLLLWAEFDTDASRFTFNKAEGGLPMVVQGNPQAFPTHARFKGGINFIQTDISETPEQTIIVLGKAVIIPTAVSNGVMLVGGWNGPPATPGYSGVASGPDIYLQTQATVSASASRDNGTGGITAASISVSGTPPDQWAVRAMRAGNGVATTVMDLTAGTRTIGTNLNKRVTGTNKLRIGSGFVSTDYTGECDISAVVILEGYQDDSAINAVYRILQIRARRLGFSV